MIRRKSRRWTGKRKRGGDWCHVFSKQPNGKKKRANELKGGGVCVSSKTGKEKVRCEKETGGAATPYGQNGGASRTENKDGVEKFPKKKKATCVKKPKRFRNHSRKTVERTRTESGKKEKKSTQTQGPATLGNRKGQNDQKGPKGLKKKNQGKARRCKAHSNFKKQKGEARGGNEKVRGDCSY